MSVTRKLLVGSWLTFALASAGIAWVVKDNAMAVKVRYALTSYVGDGSEIYRRPSHLPAEFVLEEGAIPPELAEAMSELALSQLSDTFRRAIAVVDHLGSGPGPGRGELDTDIVTTYKAVLDDGYGDCTDYARLYTGLAYVSGVTARIWTTSFEGFSNAGHVFSEFYAEGHGWVFVDPINSFFVLDGRSQKPLSVLEFRDRLRGSDPSNSLVIQPISQSAFGFDSAADAIAYYRRGADRFALRMANDVFSYDRLPWVRWFRPHSKALEQALSIFFGQYPKLLILETDGNRDELAALKALRERVYWALALWVLSLTLGVGAGIVAYRRARGA